MTQWDYPQPYIEQITVGAQAIDRMGHVNNCHYLLWLEQVAWGHSNALGVSWQDYQDLDRALVARETRVQYLAAGFEEDVLQVGTWISENDQRLMMTRIYQIVRPADGATLLRGYTRWVSIQLSSGKPKRMPALFQSHYPVTVPANTVLLPAHCTGSPA